MFLDAISRNKFALGWWQWCASLSLPDTAISEDIDCRLTWIPKQVNDINLKFYYEAVDWFRILPCALTLRSRLWIFYMSLHYLLFCNIAKWLWSWLDSGITVVRTLFHVGLVLRLQLCINQTPLLVTRILDGHTCIGARLHLGSFVYGECRWKRLISSQDKTDVHHDSDHSRTFVRRNLTNPSKETKISSGYSHFQIPEVVKIASKVGTRRLMSMVSFGDNWTIKDLKTINRLICNMDPQIQDNPKIASLIYSQLAWSQSLCSNMTYGM